jgi:hypothetical protein
VSLVPLEHLIFRLTIAPVLSLSLRTDADAMSQALPVTPVLEVKKKK